MFDENYYKELRRDIENAYNQEMRKQRQKQANLSYNSLGTEHLVPRNIAQPQLAVQYAQNGNVASDADSRN